MDRGAGGSAPGITRGLAQVWGVDMPPDLLIRLAWALVLGDWRTVIDALFSGERLGGAGETANMIKCLRYLALSMRAQCAASDVALAQEHLDAAARLLASPAPRSHRAKYDLNPLRQLIEQLLERERADLAAVRKTFSASTKGRQELVYACVERLVWVDEDPYTLRAAGGDQEVLGLDDKEYHRFWPMNRTEMIARIARFRRFAGTRGGSISERTWQRAGGARALVAEALGLLAIDPLQPRSQVLPVRLGRQEALEHARRLFRNDLYVA